jgi:hypothetical protein
MPRRRHSAGSIRSQNWIHFGSQKAGPRMAAILSSMEEVPQRRSEEEGESPRVFPR